MKKTMATALMMVFVLTGCLGALQSHQIKDYSDRMSCMLVGEAWSSFPSPFTKTPLGNGAFILENSQGCSWKVQIDDGVIVDAIMHEGPCTFNREQFDAWMHRKGCQL